MDPGHYNCRDYYISPHFAATTLSSETSTLGRHESFEELERRSRSPDADKAKFPLLQLPLEIRQHILSYILPYTQEFKDSGRLSEHVRNFSAVKKRSAKGMHVPTGRSNGSNAASNIVWKRGKTNVFSVCKQLHQECAELVYGTNVFLLFVTYPEIHWCYRWLLPSGLAPRRSYPFLKLLPERYMRLIKRVVVHVDHVDSYMGMIKFGVGGQGLIHGLKRQVQRLVIALGSDEISEAGYESGGARRLNQINIMLNSETSQLHSESTALSQQIEDILEPFSYLGGVRVATVGGAVSSHTARELIAQMKAEDPYHTIPKLLDEGMSSLSKPGGVQLCVYGNDL